MKLLPFDFEKAKAGAKVAMRNGTAVRLICFDRKGRQPIVGLVESSVGIIEDFESWSEDGTYFAEPEDRHSDLDLFLLAEPKLVPWTREDVPPVCWVRRRIQAICDDYASVRSFDNFGVVAGARFIDWLTLKADYEWSPDPRDPSLWKPCAKEVWE